MQDEKFISKYSQKIGGPVLELASGTGRLSKVILEEGLDYTGIDLSKEFSDLVLEKRGRVGILIIKKHHYLTYGWKHIL